MLIVSLDESLLLAIETQIIAPVTCVCAIGRPYRCVCN